MHTTFVRGAVLAGMLAFVYAFHAHAPAAHAGAPKNLKVFPKGTTKKELKKVMKGIAKALDVECDFCHDMEDMSKDTDKKKRARGMMRMVARINKQHFKGKPRVRCVTCHNGRKKPK